uniref:OKR_DC_1 domain-containing protein n=1 Tax=Macrostomum lignano TaxID=282301 RepID=A0A1I8HZQ0_9PLAT
MPSLKPVSRALVVSNDAAWLEPALSGLASASARLDNPFGIAFVSAHTGDHAMQTVKADGDLQLVVIDKSLAGLGAGQAALDLANRINSWRPELSLYVVLSDDERAMVEELVSHAVDGYFDRDEPDYHGWFRILSAELAEKSATPFYDALQAYVKMAKDSWHSPGHSGGDSLKNSPWVSDFYEFVGENLLRADLSVSVPMLDSLLHPTGVIATAQNLAATAFGARKTYLATNGTSTTNKIIFQTLLAPGDKLLLDRNCHKSVHHGVILSDARPIYLDSSVCREFGIFGPVPKATIYRAIKENPDAKALILTCCTYDGMLYDLKPIVEAAHKAGIKVIIDEAWYAFARFHPAFRPTALECGADYVTQSIHKTLTSFSQASMVHVNDPEFDEHLFRENFNMYASTSPQYALIASLDVGRKQAMMEGYKLLDRTLKLGAELRQKINSTGVFRVLDIGDLLPDEVRNDGVRLDPTKLTVDISKSGYSADEMEQVLFDKYNIQGEKSTFSTLTLLLGVGTTRSKVSRLCDAMFRLAKDRRRVPKQSYRMAEVPHFSWLACLPRSAFYESGECLYLLDDDGRPNEALTGRVCCDQVLAYPPGIPVLVPGQVITPPITSYLAKLLKGNKPVEVHGLADIDGEYAVRVLTQEELEAAPSRSLFLQDDEKAGDGDRQQPQKVQQLEQLPVPSADSVTEEVHD